MAQNAPDSSPPRQLRFLSTEWVSALGELVPTGEGTQLALGQVVEGSPDGDVSYTILLGARAGADAGRAIAGTVDGADVVLVESYDTARGLSSGSLSPGEAIGTGRVKVRGAAHRLTASHDLLIQLADALRDLHLRTTY